MMAVLISLLLLLSLLLLAAIVKADLASASASAASLTTDCSGVICEHGICSADVSSGGRHHCFCEDGYTGPHCETEWNECWSSPCANGATCLDRIAHFNCTCVPGFTGRQCEINIDECKSSPCANGGTCVDGVNGYDCICRNGYAGPTCNIDVSVCHSAAAATDGDSSESATKLCRHGGICRDGIADAFSCDCPPGWTGPVCEINVDECSTVDVGAVDDVHGPGQSPCLNGGTCHDVDGAFVCACRSGFKGERCEVALQPCTDGDNPCENDSLCFKEDDGGGVECFCVPDFHGDRCQFQYDDCLLPSVPKCVNGGSCVDGVGGFTCACVTGYVGPFCECQLADAAARDADTAATVEVTLTSSDGTDVIVLVVKPCHFVNASTITGHLWLNGSASGIGSDGMTETLSTVSKTTATTESTTWAAEAAVSHAPLQISTVDARADAGAEVEDEAEAEVEAADASIKSTTAEVLLDVDIGTDELSTESALSTSSDRSAEAEPVNTDASIRAEGDAQIDEAGPAEPDVLQLDKEAQEAEKAYLDGANPDSSLEACHCSNGGECVRTVVGLRCQCPLQFTGTECERYVNINIVGFVGYSHLTYVMRRPDDDDVETAPPQLPFALSLTFRAAEANGYLLYASNVQSGLVVASYIEDGLLRTRFRCGESSGTILFTAADGTSRVNASVWTEFGLQLDVVTDVEGGSGGEVASTHCQAIVTLNGTQVMSGRQELMDPTSVASSILPTRFDFGGLSPETAASPEAASTATGTGLRGCMRNFTLLGRPIDVYRLAASGRDVVECNASPCTSHACLNGAVCGPDDVVGDAVAGSRDAANATTWSCQCLPGFRGDQCGESVCVRDASDVSADNAPGVETPPCANGATCLPTADASASAGGYICLCPAGYQGARCETPLWPEQAKFTASVGGYSSYQATVIPLPSPPPSAFVVSTFRMETANVGSQVALLLFAHLTSASSLAADDVYSTRSQPPVPYWAVSLVKGHILLTWDVGGGGGGGGRAMNDGGGARRIFTRSPVDGRYTTHVVRFGFAGARAWLQVNDMHNVTGIASSDIGQVGQDAASLAVYVGGHPRHNFTHLPHDLSVHRGFDGCLYDVAVRVASNDGGDDNGWSSSLSPATAGLTNGGAVRTYMPFAASSATIAARSATGRNVYECAWDVCRQRRPCMNGGRCISFGSSYSCRCRDGWTGLWCETSRVWNDCSALATVADVGSVANATSASDDSNEGVAVAAAAHASCATGSICVARLDRRRRHQCVCPIGRSGDRCEIYERMDEAECVEVKASGVAGASITVADGRLRRFGVVQFWINVASRRNGGDDGDDDVDKGGDNNADRATPVVSVVTDRLRLDLSLVERAADQLVAAVRRFDVDKGKSVNVKNYRGLKRGMWSAVTVSYDSLALNLTVDGNRGAVDYGNMSSARHDRLDRQLNLGRVFEVSRLIIGSGDDVATRRRQSPATDGDDVDIVRLGRLRVNGQPVDFGTTDSGWRGWDVVLCSSDASDALRTATATEAACRCRNGGICDVATTHYIDGGGGDSNDDDDKVTPTCGCPIGYGGDLCDERGGARAQQSWHSLRMSGRSSASAHVDVSGARLADTLDVQFDFVVENEPPEAVVLLWIGLVGPLASESTSHFSSPTPTSLDAGLLDMQGLSADRDDYLGLGWLTSSSSAPHLALVWRLGDRPSSAGRLDIPVGFSVAENEGAELGDEATSHRVRLVRRGRLIHVSVAVTGGGGAGSRTTTTRSARIGGPFSQLDVDPVVQFGGLGPAVATVSRAHFDANLVGCIANVTIKRAADASKTVRSFVRPSATDRNPAYIDWTMSRVADDHNHHSSSGSNVVRRVSGRNIFAPCASHS